MKRACNEQERKVLFQNRAMFCKGIFVSKSKGSFIRFLLSILIPIVIAVVLTFCIMHFFQVRNAKMIFRICCISSVVILGPITAILFEKISIMILEKKFLRSDTVFVNGATIVGVDNENKRILYIEDDVFDENGKYILFSYPSTEEEIHRFKSRERGLMLYDQHDNFHLLKLNGKLGTLVPIGKGPYISTDDLLKLEPIPHMNVLKIEKEERALSTVEKERFSKIYAKLWAQASLAFSICIGGVIIGLVMWVSVIIGRDVDSLNKTLMIGGGISVMVCLLVVASYWGVQFYFIQKCKFISIKEVVLDSFEYGENNVETAHVYEWDVNKLDLKTYFKVNYSFSMRYGGVLYKLRTTENEVVILSKDELLKKRMISG